MDFSKLSRYFFAAVLAFFLCGCRIEFNATSIVHENGTLERQTAYKAQEPSDKEQILNRYELPEGGTWTDLPLPVFKFLKKEPVNQTISSYDVKKVIPSKQQPATDFKRLTMAKDRFASNEFSVRVRDWWFVKWYDYQEIFRDIIELGKVKEVIDKILDKGLTTFRSELAKRTSNEDFINELMKEAGTKYAELLSRYYHLVSDKGWDFSEVEKLNQQIQQEFSAEAVSALLTKHLPQWDNVENRGFIAEAFHATDPVLTEYLNNNEDLRSQSDLVFGIHGVPIFQSYDFAIRVKMPGEVIKTNAPKHSQGVLEWTFSGTKLNQHLKARSRKLYPLRLGLLVLSVLAMLVFFIYRPYRTIRKKRQSRKRPPGQND